MRTIQQIYDQIITEKQSLSTLSGLLPASTNYSGLLAAINSGSKVAEWRLWVYVIAVACWVQELLWDGHKAEVAATVEKGRFGTLAWYIDEAKRFQLGDTYTMVNYYPAYDPVDPSKQIITQASASESQGFVFVKVAKGKPLAPLTSTELAQFTEFMRVSKPAGVLVQCSSLAADILRIFGTIYYDPILDPVVVVQNAETAIEAYLAALPFDGRLYLSAMADVVQAVPGVVDVVMDSVYVDAGMTSTLVQREYVAAAGYMKYSTVASNWTIAPAP